MRPNAGIEMAFRKRLECLIDEMNTSVLHWLRASYRANEPEIAAMDASPANELKKVINAMSRRWLRKFNDAGKKLGRHFAKAASKRSDAALMKMLKEAGFVVDFKMTPAVQDIISASVNENVSLIKSIPEQYLKNVNSLVMESVRTGRDLHTLSSKLMKQHGVSRRRAALIARDQNNKATSAMQRARQTEYGLNEAIWLHSTAGKTPRPTHVAMNGKKYDVRQGMWDEKEKAYVWPGQLINCRCVSKTVVPGFS